MSRAFKSDVPRFPGDLIRSVRAPALLALFLLLPVTLAAQEDTTVTFRLRFPAELPGLQTPVIFRSPWVAGARLPVAQVLRIWDSTLTARRDSLRIAQVTAWRLRQVYGRRAEPTPTDSIANQRGLLGISRRYADLTMDGIARLEIRTERLHNLKCTSSEYLDLNSGCRGGFKAPRLDNHIALRANGLLGQRFHVNVDYDSDRDFNAHNDLQLYYQGLEDEVVRRVEIGTVTFQPPPSRFLTAGIPANNFGVNATIDVGPLSLQGVAATQKGSVVAERSYAVGSTTVQPQDRESRDLDFEGNRFFWVTLPESLPGYPAIDILQLDRTTLPPAALIDGGDVRVYRYRPAGQTGFNPNFGGINAVAVSVDGDTVKGVWELLRRDVDYYADASGLWFALAARLNESDYLAVSYLSSAGPVGTFPAQDRGPTPTLDSLRLIVEPRVGPTRATFRYEMRQAYRVAGSDLDPASLLVALSLNRSERPQKGDAQSTYLAQLGLATPADPNTFNLSDRLFPRIRDPGAANAIHESFIVFPHLQPFADPARLLQQERNDSLYHTPGYLLLSEGPPAKFVFRLRYNASSTGDRSRLDLGALEIREGSDALYLNGRRLERSVDYTINYDLGQVTFLDPVALFGNNAAAIQARFEERGVFAVAPTQIFGLTGRYRLGEAGGINLMGLYQVEQSAFNRPQLGFEAQANMVGGVSADLRFKPEAITRALNHLTGSPSTAPSRIELNGELALTRPDPNRSGQAYLEEFEGDPGLPLSLRESSWGFGSRPQSALGVSQIVGSVFDTADAVQLTWQNLVPDPSTGRALELHAQDIDDRIQVAGAANQIETALFLALQADTAGGLVRPPPSASLRWVLPTRLNAPRWRSMVTALSSSGVDLSRNEFLEFWVLRDATQSVDAAGVSLMFDLGSVSEDAVAMAPESLGTTLGDSIFSGRQFVGRGMLDTEREPSGIFNAALDDIGILGDRPEQLIVDGQPVTRPALCQSVLSQAVLVYPWGDQGARCSNGNGVLDAEDLDGDNQLDANGSAESSFRWVVNLGATGTPYYVRTGVRNPDGSEWRLYRLPLRQPEETIGGPNIRLVKHLRVTVLAEPDQGGPDRRALFGLARMRFLGSPWSRRADRPIQGIAGATAEPVGDVVASTVSTENPELGYLSPPGVTSGLSKKGSTGEFGSQINERSLRLIARQIGLGQRAEAYYRFPSGAQNLLKYRELRAWARGRGPGWGRLGNDFIAYIRVGSDSRNFYQFSAPADTTTWDPEFRVSLDRWRSLRAVIETRRLEGLGPDSTARVACGGDTISVAYVVCDGSYLVYIEDPAISPPNLAQVQEMAAGVLRVGTASGTDSAEVWVDDLRLFDPISRVGTALALDVRVVGSDVGEVSAGYTRQDGYFQQIGQEATYRTTGVFRLGGALRLDRFLPVGWGLAIPTSVSYTRTSVDPQLVSGTDIPGQDLAHLRRPVSWTVGYSFAVRRSIRGHSFLTQALLDPVSLTGSFTRGRSLSELALATSSGSSVNANYGAQPGRRGATLKLDWLIRLLPGFLRRSDAGVGLKEPFLNLVPSNLRFGSGLSRNASDLVAYKVPVYLSTDDQLQSVTSLSSLWHNNAGFTWQPLGMLTLSSDLASTRDLRSYSDSTSLGRIATQARRRLLGVDIGAERDRQVNTSLQLRPRLASWLRPRYVATSNFLLSRFLTSRSPVRVEGDTAGAFILPQTLNNSRTAEYGAAVDLGRFLGRLFGDSSGVTRQTRRIRSLDVADRLIRTSVFDLATFNPGFGYQLALGGLGDFLHQDGDAAIQASESRTTSLTSGADLPLGVSLSVAYSRSRITRFQRVNGGFLTSESFQREWPSGSVRVSQSLRGFPVASFGIGTSFRTLRGTTRTQSFGGLAPETRTHSANWTPDLSIVLRNGIILTSTYSILNQRNAANGNTTQLKQRDLTSGMSYDFVLPRSISVQPRRVRSQLTASLSRGETCLNRGGSADCAVVSDTRRQELRGSLDTDIAKTLTGGLQFSYSINEARHLDRKFSQMIIQATFQLSLFAGDYR